MDSLPNWMIPPSLSDSFQEEIEATGEKRRKARGRRGIEEFVRIAHRLAEDASNRDGFLQGFDERVKVASMVGMVVVATFLHRIESLSLCLLVSLILAAHSRIPFRRSAALWLAIPLFSALMTAPAALNLVTPGAPLFSVARLPLIHGGAPIELAVTRSGALVVVRFVLRTMVCVTLTGSLAATSSPLRLLKGLRSLGVPVLFVATLQMMTRYLSLLARGAEEIRLAKKSRMIRSESAREGRIGAASGIGSLFRRAHRLGQQVFLAMTARGYDGEIRLLDETKPRLKDWGFAFGMACFGIALLRIG